MKKKPYESPKLYSKGENLGQGYESKVSELGPNMVLLEPNLDGVGGKVYKEWALVKEGEDIVEEVFGKERFLRKHFLQGKDNVVAVRKRFEGPTISELATEEGKDDFLRNHGE